MEIYTPEFKLDIPENITRIKLPNHFNDVIDRNTFHEKIELIIFNDNYNKNINYLPITLKELYLSYYFNSNITCLKYLFNLKVLKLEPHFKNIDFDQLPESLELLIIENYNVNIINNYFKKLKYIKIFKRNLENLFAENLYIRYGGESKDFNISINKYYKNFDNIFVYEHNKSNMINFKKFKNIDDELFEKGDIIELDNLKIGNYITEHNKVYLMKITVIFEKQKIKNEIKNEIENLKNKIIELEKKLEN